MGASVFDQIAFGKDAKEAFAHGHEQACYEHGHGGYSGSLAEKAEVVVIEERPMPLAEARAMAAGLVQQGDPRIDDKWGPAGAIRLEDVDGSPGQRWLFFGWASC